MPQQPQQVGRAFDHVRAGAVNPLHPGVTEIAVVDPEQLEEALTMDGMQAPASNIDAPKVEP